MKKFIIAVILAVLFASCGDDDIGGGSGSGGSGGTGNGFIYIGGSYTDSGVEKACYWVDGERYELNGTSVENIIAVGNTMYAAGYYDEDGVLKACYWINQTRHDLSGLRIEGFYDYGQISVDSGNVYIVGVYDGNGNEDNAKVTYWVNGIRREPPADGIMSDVYAANGSVYIVGSYDDGGTLKPCYWINGSRLELPNIAAGSPDWIGGTIIVKDNKIYVSCNFDFEYSSYWIDGVQQKVLTDAIIAFAVSGGDVYMAGSSGVYKNSEIIIYQEYDNRMTFPPFHTMFAVSRGKVYTCGSESEYINGGYVYNACYWVDGEQFFLDGAYAYAIFVKE